MAETFLRLPDVKARTGLSKTEIYRKIKEGTFPAQRRVSAKVVIWAESHVIAWQASILDPEAADLLG